MKQFSKAQREHHAACVALLRQKQGLLEAAITEFNNAMADQYRLVEHARDALQEEIDEANTFIGSLRDDAQAYYDDRSEKWQEDEAGQQYQDWITDIEAAEIAAVEIPEPDPLEEATDIDDEISTFEDLRTGVEE